MTRSPIELFWTAKKPKMIDLFHTFKNTLASSGSSKVVGPSARTRSSSPYVNVSVALRSKKVVPDMFPFRCLDRFPRDQRNFVILNDPPQ